MTTSGTYTFSDNTQVNQIITESFERLGIFGEQVSGDMMSSAINSFNYLLTSWVGDESRQWAYTSLFQHACVPGQMSFQLLDGQYDIIDMVYRLNNVDVGMSQISRTEYLYITEKTIQSVPTQWFLDKSVYPARVYMYPVPNTPLITLVYTVVSMPQDINDPSFQPNATPWYTEALTAGLTARLAEKFKPEVIQEKKALADIAYGQASRGDLNQEATRIRSPYRFG